MCGIAGFVQRKIDPATLDAMVRCLSHRGPDGRGTKCLPSRDWTAALGHTRLAIIDLSGGHQPLANEDASLHITFNGEIYNFRQLHQTLESQGHRFATRSDTEVIVHHFEQHDLAGIAQLNGMFALALWDDKQCRLVLARDRMGIKPLYYAPLEDGGIAFASELSSLLKHPGVSREIDRDGLISYFFSDSIPAPRTIIRNVFKLPPGCFLEWKDGTLKQPVAFWSLDQIRARENLPDEHSLAGELWRVAGDAVEAQLVADVPVGVFLSGGIDSSTIAALAVQRSSSPIHTYSIAFEDAQWDESAYARKVADHLKTVHTEETLRESALLDHLDPALDCLDEPMADPSIVPTFLLSRLAARHVKVALGGDGGDELWAGYPTCKAYRHAKKYELIPQFIRNGLFKPIIAALPVKDAYQSLEWKAKRFALRYDDDPLVRHLRWMSCVDLPELGRIIGEAKLPDFWSKFITPKFGNDLNSILALDVQTYMPGSILTKVDRAAMAHGLEVRPPLLDNTMVDFAFSLPSHLKLHGSTSKWLLKQSATPYLPGEIISRRKKGFGIPLLRWIKGPLRQRVDALFKQESLWASGLLNRETFEQWWTEHQAGKVDHSRPLWALLVLGRWAGRLGIRI